VLLAGVAGAEPVAAPAPAPEPPRAYWQDVRLELAAIASYVPARQGSEPAAENGAGVRVALSHPAYVSNGYVAHEWSIAGGRGNTAGDFFDLRGAVGLTTGSNGARLIVLGGLGADGVGLGGTGSTHSLHADLAHAEYLRGELHFRVDHASSITVGADYDWRPGNSTEIRYDAAYTTYGLPTLTVSAWLVTYLDNSVDFGLGTNFDRGSLFGLGLAVSR
jgi:hypothetical protein